MSILRFKMGFDNLFVVDCMGCSGGLALLWNEDVNLEIQNYSFQHINAVVKDIGRNFQWKLTCFYDNPKIARRSKGWSLLHHLQHFSPEPWLCVGDFNEILTHSEKCGGALHPTNQMNAFRDVLDVCQLSDLGFMGSKFTWCNIHEDDTFTKERLDRAVANPTWCEKFGEVDVFILAA